MTFEDMMQMKRLGETAVSPDGKWLAYSVTTVDLAQNTKTAELWLQAIAGGEPVQAGRGPAGRLRPAVFGRRQADSVSQRPRRAGSRSGSRTLTRQRARRRNCEEADGNLRPRHDNAKWSPDGKSIVFHVGCVSGLPGDRARRQRRRGPSATTTAMRQPADSKVKAQIWTHLLYRHWDHFTGDKRSSSLSGFG